MMDPDRARELLDAERARIDEALRGLRSQGPLEGSDHIEPGDEDSEDLYQDELDAGRLRELEDDLAALERAEERLAKGTYGLSVESGEPIPDGRLEAIPTAERTVEEEERFRRS
jgi:RNA polymerase-binding transcription factor